LLSLSNPGAVWIGAVSASVLEMPPTAIDEHFKMICTFPIRDYPFLAIFWRA
jgi:hypothetical protein